MLLAGLAVKVSFNKRELISMLKAVKESDFLLLFFTNNTRNSVLFLTRKCNVSPQRVNY
jgi:hypothetical protein